MCFKIDELVSKTLMIQGTTSDAGKSTLVTALGRYFYRQGIQVVPFKPQNMALNSAVTEDGGEIGRAQAVQAAACGLVPHTDMNPILLKPNSDQTAQVIVHGKALKNYSAQSYHDYKKQAMRAVLESHQRLKSIYPLIVVEGAGSPAEINLRDGDIANMGFAEAVDCPVILIADIDKGGVFAHLIGTLQLLSRSEQNRVIGFVINRFRGDIELLKPGLEWLEQQTSKPVFAVLPYLHELYLDAEDAIDLEKQKQQQKTFHVVIPRFPRISNHTDFDPLLLNPELTVSFAYQPKEITHCDVIILPGSKSVRADLEWLRKMGWDHFINRHLRYGGRIIGLCGGYQMLGNLIHDNNGIEGSKGTSQGLALLDLETELKPEKQLTNKSGRLAFDKTSVKGYEIHAGVTTGSSLSNPATILEDIPEGAISEDGLVLGTYLHGIFDRPEACRSLLRWAGLEVIQTIDLEEEREKGINFLADQLELHFNFDELFKAMNQFAHQKNF